MQALQEKQLNEIELSLKTAKRPGLKKLFGLLRDKLEGEEPDNAEVFKKVLGRKYSKQEDYLLRNEYRLLYERLVSFVSVSNSLETENETFKLLQFLLSRKADELFEEEFGAAWKKAAEADELDTLLHLSDLNIDFYLTTKPQTLANAEKVAWLSKQRVELLQRKLLRDVRKEEVRLKLSERIISAYKNIEEPYEPLQAVNLDLLQENDLYAGYLSQRARINFASGAQKIELLKEILADEDVIRKYEKDPLDSLCRFWLNMAQEYYITSAYKEAIPYFDKVYANFKELAEPLKETCVLNYVLALTRNGDLEKAIEIGTLHAEVLLNGKILSNRGPFLVAVLHLYARQADEAERYVSFESKKEGSEFYFFMRLILSAVYYLRGEVALAARECINVDQAINYEMNRDFTKQTEISKPIVAVFKRFYHILQTTTPDKLKEELLALNAQITETLSGKGDQSPNSILTDWLRREIEYRSAALRK